MSHNGLQNVHPPGPSPSPQPHLCCMPEDNEGHIRCDPLSPPSAQDQLDQVKPLKPDQPKQRLAPALGPAPNCGHVGHAEGEVKQVA